MVSAGVKGIQRRRADREVREEALRRETPKIAILDLFPGPSVGYLRHNGFLKGFGVAGISPKDCVRAVVNGALVTKIRLPAFIVTLGTLNIAMALVHIYSNEQTIANRRRR